MPLNSCSQRFWKPHGQRWHMMAASAASGPWFFSRSIRSATETAAIWSVKPRVRRSQSRGTWSGGVCQKTRLILPSFIWTVPPWGKSTVKSVRGRRRAAPSHSPRGAPLLRLPSASRPAPADARELAAGRAEGTRVLRGHLEAPHLGLEPADSLQVLVLAERRLDG